MYSKILLFLSFLISIIAPAQENSLLRYEYSHPQMGTVFKIIVYSEKKEIADEAVKRAFNRVDTLNQILSDYLPESEINQLCLKVKDNAKVPVSKDLWHILKVSAYFSQESNGAFDVTIGAVTRLWRRARNLKELPDSIQLQTALQSVNYQDIKFYRRKHRVSLLHNGTKLDFGGIAQGYAADECIKILCSFGLKIALADAGGDIALGDAPPQSEGWEIEVPQSVGSPKILFLKNCGITTSGAKYRFLEVNNKRYSHIIDPRTGWGLSNRVLVTVHAPTATMADAWATAISVLGEKEWEKIKKRHPKVLVTLTEEKL
jgi:FAD:protein FMN transferase